MRVRATYRVIVELDLDIPDDGEDHDSEIEEKLKSYGVSSVDVISEDLDSWDEA